MAHRDTSEAADAVHDMLAGPLFRSVRSRGTADAARAFVGTRCPLCRERMTAESVRWMPVVPSVFMPPVSTDPAADRMGLCARCAVSRAAGDLLDAPGAIVPTALIDRRTQIMLSALHHLTPAAKRADERVKRIITARAAQPRAHLVAAPLDDGSVVLGWSAACGGPWTLGTHAARLRATQEAKRLDAREGVTLWHVPPASALDAIWAAIEAGALVSSTAPVDISAADWRTAWAVHYRTWGEHARRLDPRTLWPIPVPERSPLSTTPDAVRRRAMYAQRANDQRVAAQWAAAGRALVVSADTSALINAWEERCALRAEAQRLGLDLAWPVAAPAAAI